MAFLAGFVGKIKDYFSTKITADNYKWYKENIKEWKRLYIKYIDNKKLYMLKEYEKALDKFYDINVDRNQYFIDNLDFIKEVKKVEGKNEGEESELEKVIGSLKEAKSVNVVVTGGFHTGALSEMLGKEGISYIVITPNVSEGVEEAERAYHELAKEQSKILFQSLATMPLSQTATIEQKLVGLAQVLIQQQKYGTQEINEGLEYIATRLEPGTVFRMAGDVKKEGEEVKITINGKEFIRNGEGVFVEQRGQEEAVKPLEKSSKSAGLTALVSFILSNISLVFLILIPFMSPVLPFMFIPLAVMIPCSIVAFFEFWQDMEISDARNKLGRQVEKFFLSLKDKPY